MTEGEVPNIKCEVYQQVTILLSDAAM